MGRGTPPGGMGDPVNSGLKEPSDPQEGQGAKRRRVALGIQGLEVHKPYNTLIRC